MTATIKAKRSGDPAVSDAAKIQQLVRRAWNEARPIDMGHLVDADRVMVCDTIVDLIEAISPRLKRGPAVDGTS